MLPDFISFLNLFAQNQSFARMKQFEAFLKKKLTKKVNVALGGAFAVPAAYPLLR